MIFTSALAQTAVGTCFQVIGPVAVAPSARFTPKVVIVQIRLSAALAARRLVVIFIHATKIVNFPHMG